MCGKEYEACHTLRPNLGSEFRWQDVACCPEHGSEYLRQILISRGELSDKQNVNEAKEPTVRTARKQRRKKAVTEAEDSSSAE